MTKAVRVHKVGGPEALIYEDAELAAPGLLDRAAERAERLARQAGDHADGLRAEAERRLDRWRAAAG